MKEKRKESVTVEIDIPIESFQYLEELATKEKLTVGKYIWEWLEGIVANDKIM